MARREPKPRILSINGVVVSEMKVGVGSQNQHHITVRFAIFFDTLKKF